MDEVRDLRDRALAMTLYARQAKNRALEADAFEIRIRAEARLGEMMAVQKATVGLATGTAGQGRPPLGGLRKNPPNTQLPTLAAAGMDKNLAHRARTLAAMPKRMTWTA